MVNTQVFGTCNSCSNQDTSTNRKIFQIYLFFQKTVCIFILEQRKIIFDCRFPRCPGIGTLSSTFLQQHPYNLYLSGEPRRYTVRAS